MKNLLLHIIILSSLPSLSQMSSNSITVRKLTEDLPIIEMVRYSDVFYKNDSVITSVSENLPKELKGMGGRDWLFDIDKLYLFRSPLNRRMRRLANKKERNFGN